MTEPAVEEAARSVARGELVAYPTETVWGLGVDARSPEAMARLRAWKGRDADRPVSILADEELDLGALGIRVPPAARRLMERFWPGPLTLVLPCDGTFAPGVTRESDGAVGVRCSSHAVARSLARRLRELGAGPLTSTSLNRSGEADVVDLASARAVCGDAIGVVAVEGAAEPAGTASTVVDCTVDPPAVLREGAVGAVDLDGGASA